MKKPERVHLLFERSGTFRNAFQRVGITAIDYDLKAEHEKVRKIDIFHEIAQAYLFYDETIFADFKENDLVFAFFPCTYFSDQSQLASRGDSYGQRNLSLAEKLNQSRVQMFCRADFYDNLCKLVWICLKKNLRLIIENPYGKVNFLKQFFPLKPALVIRDRRAIGDFFKKPTQFFFVNCEPEFCLLPEYGDRKQKKSVEETKGFERSRISPKFAENFIESFILEN